MTSQSSCNRGFLSLLLVMIAVGRCVAQDNPLRFVDPFIGTSNGGNTFPGAVCPWGMVSVSPHTAPGAPSGYIHGAEYLYGFGHVHLSGTGCAELGSAVLAFSRGEIRVDPDSYRCHYSDEEASPGFYRVRLAEPDVSVEATATTRCGLTRVSTERKGMLNILFDAGRSLSLLGGGEVRIVSPTTFEGFTLSGGFCGESNRERIYFAAELSLAPRSSGIWIGQRTSSARSGVAHDTAVGVWFQCPIDPRRPILIAVGISYVSVENARENLRREVQGRSFEDVRGSAESAWRSALSRIEIEGGLQADRVKFTTALYHILIHPNIISDMNGQYPLPDQGGVGSYTDRNRYSVFSLWDTYRTVHPFLALVYPERQSEIVRTMIDISKESGWLPKWEIASNETHLMVGDPAVPVIAETYLAGIQDFDVEAGYTAMKKAAVTPGPESDPVRPGYHDDLKYMYIPFEQDTTAPWWVWGPVSTTLEYSYDDWTIGQVASRLGRTSDAREFARRSLFYKNLFDPVTEFMRPKRKDGTWLTPFDPKATEGSGSWSGSGGPGYVEGNAWQYTWFVPHGVDTLIELFGGPEKFTRKLTQCFSSGQFTINNEPDIAYPYLFTYIPGEQNRSVAQVRRIMDRDFGTGPGGLPGNDDCGTISGWFVFSALGFYPACPASGEYRLGVPLFDKIHVRLNSRYYPGTEFTIETIGNVHGAVRVKGIELNGSPVDDYRIAHSSIVAGGKLVFRLEADSTTHD